jgi:hypothetical protein
VELPKIGGITKVSNTTAKNKQAVVAPPNSSKLPSQAAPKATIISQKKTIEATKPSSSDKAKLNVQNGASGAGKGQKQSEEDVKPAGAAGLIKREDGYLGEIIWNPDDSHSQGGSISFMAKSSMKKRNPDSSASHTAGKLSMAKATMAAEPASDGAGFW